MPASPGRRAHYQDVLYEIDRATAFGHAGYKANLETERTALEAEDASLRRANPAVYTAAAVRDLPENLYTHLQGVLPGHPQRGVGVPPDRSGGPTRPGGTPPGTPPPAA